MLIVRTYSDLVEYFCHEFDFSALEADRYGDFELSHGEYSLYLMKDGDEFGEFASWVLYLGGRKNVIASGEIMLGDTSTFLEINSVINNMK